MNKLSQLYKIICLLFIVQVFGSCKKFVIINPPIDQLGAVAVFQNDATAVQAITGIYSEMMNRSQQFSSGSSTYYGGFSADELYYYSPSFRDEFVKNSLTPLSHGTIESNFWSPAYRYIYAANNSIEQLQLSTKLTSSVRTMLLGEAKFIRAFCYFYLVNFFGEIPLIVASNYQQNLNVPRSSVSTIYAQIIKDLEESKQALLPAYPTAGRVRPNQFAASSLLARVYLYQKNWEKAAIEAGTVINSGVYKLEDNLTSVFLSGSNEAIWQLYPVTPSRNTWEGSQIIPSSNGSQPTYVLTPSLVASFEQEDARREAWTKERNFAGSMIAYPVKYKIRTGAALTEYYLVLRLAELYLIRAEASAQLDDLPGSASDINAIRTRAGLSSLNTLTKQELLLSIEQERKVEFFAEWGHRWFDLKRTQRANAVIGALKGAAWQATDVLYPIPKGQIDLNKALTQNPGY